MSKLFFKALAKTIFIACPIIVVMVIGLVWLRAWLNNQFALAVPFWLIYAIAIAGTFLIGKVTIGRDLGMMRADQTKPPSNK